MNKLFAALLVLNSCSSIFWREGKLAPELNFSENKTYLLYSRIYFQEKSSWNPLDGTTLKKDYKTILQIAEINKDLKLNKNLKPVEIPSWILPNTTTFHYKEKIASFILGKNKEEFGTGGRIAAFFNFNEAKLSSIEEILNPIDLTLSPSGKNLLVLFKENNLYKVKIFELTRLKAIEEFEIKNFTILSDGDSEVVWTEKEIFIKGYNICTSIDLNTKTQAKCNANNKYKESNINIFKGNYSWSQNSLDLEEIQLNKN